jgi:hypothetical protein
MKIHRDTVLVTEFVGVMRRELEMMTGVEERESERERENNKKA